MPMPPSVVRINRDGVEYTSSVDRTQYLMEELERAALRDIGKLLRARAKALVPKDSGAAKKSLSTWVRKSFRGKPPNLQLGYYNKAAASKKGLKYVGYYTHILEFGSSRLVAKRPLRTAVQDHIPDIVAITAAYLGRLSGGESSANRGLDETEEVADT